MMNGSVIQWYNESPQILQDNIIVEVGNFY